MCNTSCCQIIIFFFLYKTLKIDHTFEILFKKYIIQNVILITNVLSKKFISIAKITQFKDWEQKNQLHKLGYLCYLLNLVISPKNILKNVTNNFFFC